MKKQVIKLNEAQLNQIISESVRQYLSEDVDEGLGQWLKNVGKGVRNGVDAYKTGELVDNDSNRPSKFNAFGGRDIEDYMNQIAAQEYKLQSQLNALRKKRKELEKYYNVSKGKGVKNAQYTANAMNIPQGFNTSRGNANRKAVDSNNNFVKQTVG